MLIILLQGSPILALIPRPSFVHTHANTAYIKDKFFIRCTVHSSSVITIMTFAYMILKFLLLPVTYKVCKFLK